MNKKFVKVTAIIISVAFLIGLFAQFAYMFVFAEPANRLEAAQAVEKEIRAESGKRFRVMCEKGIGSYLDIVFSSENMSDFTDRIVIAKELAEYDKNMIKTVSKVKEEISDSQND